MDVLPQDEKVCGRRELRFSRFILLRRLVRGCLHEAVSASPASDEKDSVLTLEVQSLADSTFSSDMTMTSSQDLTVLTSVVVISALPLDVDLELVVAAVLTFAWSERQSSPTARASSCSSTSDETSWSYHDSVIATPRPWNGHVGSC